MKTYIKNGRCIFEKKIEIATIEITGSVITDIIPGTVPISADNAHIIDAKDKYVFPGVVDFHAHIQDVVGLFASNETYTSGSEVAILNGITTLNCFITQNFNQSLSQSIINTLELAKNKIYTDIRWHLTPTRFSDVNYTDIARWIEKGFNTFKFYTTFKNANLYLAYDKISEIFKRLTEYEPTFLIHCEDEAIINGSKFLQFDWSSPYTLNKIRNEDAELTAVEKIIEICKKAQIDTVVSHVSSADAIGQIELAKRDCPIISEVSTPHIFLSEDAFLEGDGYKYLLTPPLRSEYCRRMLEKKVLLNYAEIFSSFHHSYAKELVDKSKNDIRHIPYGIPSIGALFHLFSELFLHHTDFDIPSFYKKLSTNPARMAGIYPQKGTLSIGSDADILVVNPNGPERPIYGTLTNTHNPWKNKTTHFSFDYVFLRGDIVVKDDTIVNKNKMSGKPLCQE